MGTRTHLGKILLSLAVGGLFLYLAFRNVAGDELRNAFAQLDARWLVPAVGVSLLLQVFRAWRWQLELQPLERLPFGLLWVLTSVAYMAINVLPMRVGEVVRQWLLARRTTIPMSSGFGTLAVEKTMDSAVIAFYVLLGLVTTTNLPDWARGLALFPVVAFAFLAVLVVLVWRRGEQVIERRLVRVLSPRIGKWVLGVARALVDGMKILGNTRLAAGVFLVSVALWFLPILSSWIMTRAFHLDVPFNAALVVFIFIGFGTALPQAPGMIGTYQYACILALALFGVPRATALAYGLVLNAIQLTTLIAQGLVALPLAGVSLRDVVRARGEESKAA